MHLLGRKIEGSSSILLKVGVLKHGAKPSVGSIKEEWGTGLIAKQINGMRRASELGRQEEGLKAHTWDLYLVTGYGSLQEQAAVTLTLCGHG